MRFWKQTVFSRFSVFPIAGSKLQGIAGTPFVFYSHEKTLFVGDLHLGEFSLKNKVSGGVYSPTARVIGGLINEVKEHGVSFHRVIFNGDIKHVTRGKTRAEEEEMRKLLGSLGSIEVTFIRGNHDVHLFELLEGMGVNVDVRDDLVLSGVMIAHGHEDNLHEKIRRYHAREVVLGHEHPSFVFQGPSRERVVLPALITGFLRTGERVVILPSSSSLGSGSVTRFSSRNDFLSPLLREYLVLESLEFFPFDKDVGSFYVPVRVRERKSD